MGISVQTYRVSSVCVTSKGRADVIEKKYTNVHATNHLWESSIRVRRGTWNIHWIRTPGIRNFCRVSFEVSSSRGSISPRFPDLRASKFPKSSKWFWKSRIRFVFRNSFSLELEVGFRVKLRARRMKKTFKRRWSSFLRCVRRRRLKDRRPHGGAANVENTLEAATRPKKHSSRSSTKYERPTAGVNTGHQGSGFRVLFILAPRGVVSPARLGKSARGRAKVPRPLENPREHRECSGKKT